MDSSSAAHRRPECAERWPACESGAYDPRCCRFPKSCSCNVRPEESAASVDHMERLREYAEWGGKDSTYQWALDEIERLQIARDAALDVVHALRVERDA